MAVLLWAIGTGLVLRFALTSDEFVMAEVRRHGLLPRLLETLVLFSVPYLFWGAFAAWTARGIVRLLPGRAAPPTAPSAWRIDSESPIGQSQATIPALGSSTSRLPGQDEKTPWKPPATAARGSAGPRPPGFLDATLGCSLLLAIISLHTILGAIERPALFAGLLYLKGGWRRALQLFLERGTNPVVLRAAGVVAGALLLAVSAAGWWRHARSSRRRSSVAAGILLVLAAITSSGARLLIGSGTLAGVEGAPGEGSPNILILAVDSLRFDALEMTSGSAPIASEMRALAADSARFTDARVPLARTYQSWASILSGLHPLHHGVRTLYPERERRRLPERSLPRLLRSAGWTTIAVGGYCATALRELESGIDVQRTPRSEADLIVSAVALRGHPLIPLWVRAPWARALLPQVRTSVEGSDPDDVAGEAIAAWRSSGSPFFLAVFFDNPHLPYVPTWPDSTSAGTYEGPNRYSLTAGSLVEQIHAGEAATDLRLQELERDNARRLYAAAVRSVDRAIGTILRSLRKDGLERRTIVVLLADHGENLLDAGGPLAHGEAIERDRSSSIPLLLRWPDRIAPQIVPDAVTTMDLAPTLLDLAGVHAAGGFDGVSLVPRLAGGPALADRPVLLETDMWFFARETVDRLDRSGKGLAYPDFDKGLLAVEPGDPPHIVVAPEQRDAVLRARQRRIELGPWALSYLPRDGGGVFHLFRRDLDPWLTRDLSESEPRQRQEMIARFYAENARMGDRLVLPPAPGE